MTSCISGSDDERESLPRYWNYNGARLALRYESKNHVYTLLGKVTNACFLLNFKSRQIKALSNNITLNVDDMTDVIDGKICLRKPVQEVTKLLVDELFTPVVHLSQEIFDLYTNARLDIPPSLENADLQSLHRNYYFLGSTESERHLGQLRRALDGNGEIVLRSQMMKENHYLKPGMLASPVAFGNTRVGTMSAHFLERNRKIKALSNNMTFNVDDMTDVIDGKIKLRKLREVMNLLLDELFRPVLHLSRAVFDLHTNSNSQLDIPPSLENADLQYLHQHYLTFKRQCISGSDDERESLPRYWNYNGARLALRYESKNHEIFDLYTNARLDIPPSLENADLQSLHRNYYLYFRVEIIMDDQNIIERWGLFYKYKCNHIPTESGLLFLVANFCLIYIFGMENIGNVCTSESDDERESLPKAWHAGVARCVWKYKSGNHVCTLLGEGTNACFLLNFQNRKIKALSNNMTFNVDDMIDVINGKIKLRKLREVMNLLLDELFRPVLHLSRAIFDLHTNSNGQLDIPPSLENADLQYLHQHYFSGVISPTPGGYSGMYLNPHSTSNSHYFGGIEDATRRFLTPGGYDEMLVNPTHLANSQYSGGFNGSLGNWTTPGGYNGMLAYFRVEIIMEEQKIIERWGLFYNFPCHDIQTKNGLLFLVANFCLIYIFGMENIGNCTSEKNDERESLPKARNAGVACCVWKYKSGNHAYTLLGEGTNACFLLNFKNRKINALSNDITFNVDDMTDVINGRIRLRKLQEVIKLLVDDLFTPVLHLSRAVFDLHTNSNGQFDIPPSVENADLQSLHQYFFRRCMESGRYLGQLRRAPDGNSGVTSRTPGGYSGMCLNPHSASKSHYAKCIEDIISRFLTPGGYDEIYFRVEIIMKDKKIIKKWETFYNLMFGHIRTKNRLLFLLAHFCLMCILGIEYTENVCTLESKDERESLPKSWNAGVERCVWKYKSGNHVYTLLGEVANAYYLLNFKNRQVKALSNNLILNLDDMTIVIYGRISLRKPVQEVTKLLVDELFTPVLRLSQAVSYLHTNSNDQLDIPPSLENADLLYLHQHYFRHCKVSQRYLVQLRRALEGNSGVISATPGGYSGMYLNPHSSSNSNYIGGIANIPRRFLTPRGYDGMLVKPNHLTNSQYSGGFERIPGSYPRPTLGWGEMISYRPFLTNPKPLGGATETCTSESDDETESLPKAWNAGVERCVWKYKSGNHVYTLLGENRQIKALSNDLTLNVDDMTDVINGRIKLRKPVQEVTKLLLDDLYKPVLYISRAVFDLHTNSNGQLDIPPSLENADLLYLRQHLLRHCIDSERNLDGNSEMSFNPEQFEGATETSERYFRVEIIMEGRKVIEEWKEYYNYKCNHIRTKNGLLFLVAHWCLLNIVDMECAGNVCTSESDDERNSLPKVWDYDNARLALRYKSGNHVYTLLGGVKNACYLLNFKSRQIKALSNNLILNIDDMTDVLRLSRTVFDFHTNSNGKLRIPPSLKNADLKYLRQQYFRHRTGSKRNLGQLKRELDGNGEMTFNPEQFEGATKTSGTLTAAIESSEDSSQGSASNFSVSSGVISLTPGGYSGMYLNPHSSSNSHYFGGKEDATRRFLTPGGYNGMLVNPNHLTNSQYSGGFERIPGSSPRPTLGWGEMISDRPFLTNPKPLGGATETVGRFTNEIDLPEAKGQRRNSKDSDQFRPPEGLESKTETSKL
ncbi:hypothetical protein Bhyg_01963 [Pseudolycoriella hygida]|uniref:Uncharacterized protein n=1 Tax=Pseudolycoriella hygida TaxID=35572 RepID=A0A9Q0S690_9DIPT|nr:hypothetical protein Bhyg_01963 [Pseudolycoriella hygida]